MQPAHLQHERMTASIQVNDQICQFGTAADRYPSGMTAEHIGGSRSRLTATDSALSGCASSPIRLVAGSG